MSKNSLFLTLALISLLTACGSGNKQEPKANTYGYNGGGSSFANKCSPRIALSWNQNIASKCNNVNGRPMARECAIGTENFRRSARRLPCNISVADAQWGPDQSRQQAFFEINEFVLNGLMRQHGWAIGRPNHGGENPGDGPGPRF